MLHLVCVRLDINFAITPYRHWLSAADNQAIFAHYHHQDQVRAFASRLLQRYYLAAVLQTATNTIDIGYEQYGRPAIINHHADFNIAHSGEYLVMIISDAVRVGIDIQYHDSHIELHELIDMAFSAEERALIDNSSDNFWLLWSKKEALLKAIGVGFADNAYQTTSCTLEAYQQNDSYTIYSSNAIPNYSLAIAIMPPLVRQ